MQLWLKIQCSQLKNNIHMTRKTYVVKKLFTRLYIIYMAKKLKIF